MQTKNIDALYDLMNEELETGAYRLQLSNNEVIDAEVYVHEDDVIYSSAATLGDTVADTKMLILKYNKNLTIEKGVTLTPRTRKKGMLLLCEGIIANYGTISMTARGATATGQDVLLYKNEDGTYEYVPKNGAAGGVRVTVPMNKAAASQRNIGVNGKQRQTGGGATGTAYKAADAQPASSGNAAAGTSYSGGSGSGGAYSSGSPSRTSADAGGNGGTGSAGVAASTANAGGGAGNPPGSGGSGDGAGTGGLLIVFARTGLINHGLITANGTPGKSSSLAPGGGSGGGSVNIFARAINIFNLATMRADGGGNAGDGCVTFNALSEEFEARKLICKKILFNEVKYRRVISDSPMLICENRIRNFQRKHQHNIAVGLEKLSSVKLCEKKRLKGVAKICAGKILVGWSKHTKKNAKMISKLMLRQKRKESRVVITVFKGAPQDITKTLIVRRPRVKPLEIYWSKVNADALNPYGGRVLQGMIICDKINTPNHDGIPRERTLEFAWMKTE